MSLNLDDLPLAQIGQDRLRPPKSALDEVHDGTQLVRGRSVRLCVALRPRKCDSGAHHRWKRARAARGCAASRALFPRSLPGLAVRHDQWRIPLDPERARLVLAVRNRIPRVVAQPVAGVSPDLPDAGLLEGGGIPGKQLAGSCDPARWRNTPPT